jgi:uncharacterized membrane protein YecN with MAPEG domain
MEVTIFFTAFLGFWYVALSVRTIVGRGKYKVSLGSGESDDMLRRVRTHANFAEYIPLLLIVMGLLEFKDVSQIFLVLFGLSLVVGRGLHFYGLYSARTPLWPRVLGMHLTLWPLIIGCFYLLYLLL